MRILSRIILRILTYIILALYFIFFWLITYLHTFMGLDAPSHPTSMEKDPYDSELWWGIFMVTHLAALVAAFCLWMVDRTKWRIWCTLLVVSLLIIHLDRAYMSLKYPPFSLPSGEERRAIWY